MVDKNNYKFNNSKNNSLNYLSLDIIDDKEYFCSLINIMLSITDKENNKLFEELNELNYDILKSKLYKSEKLNNNNDINIKLSIPKTFHVTTFFKSKFDTFSNNQAYLEFKEDKSVLINLLAIIYIKNKSLICVVKCKDAYVNNLVPHITTLLGSYKPKESNDICESIFIKGIYKREFESYLSNDQEYIKSCFDNKSEDQFLLKVLDLNIFEINEKINIILINPCKPITYVAKMSKH